MAQRDEIIGRKFGRLTVVEVSPEKGSNGRTLYLCKCECGNTKLAPANRLRSGGVKSCGCAQIEARRNIGGSKERRGWTEEEERYRASKIYSQAEGVYQRGTLWVAQMKIRGKTYHILATPDKEAAVKARREIVQLRMYEGDDAAIRYLEKEKAARQEERTELQKQFGGFPTREQIAEMKKHN